MIVIWIFTLCAYIDPLVRNGLEKVEGGVAKYKTTGEENRGPLAIEELIPDLAVMKVPERLTKD